MKKEVLVVLVFACLFTLVSCGKKEITLEDVQEALGDTGDMLVEYNSATSTVTLTERSDDENLNLLIDLIQSYKEVEEAREEAGIEVDIEIDAIGEIETAWDEFRQATIDLSKVIGENLSEELGETLQVELVCEDSDGETVIVAKDGFVTYDILEE